MLDRQVNLVRERVLFQSDGWFFPLCKELWESVCNVWFGFRWNVGIVPCTYVRASVDEQAGSAEYKYKYEREGK